MGKILENFKAGIDSGIKKSLSNSDKNEFETTPAGYIYYLSESHQVFSFEKKDWHESGTGLWTEIPLFKKVSNS